MIRSQSDQKNDGKRYRFQASGHGYTNAVVYVLEAAK
jgi:hypothetical protein